MKEFPIAVVTEKHLRIEAALSAAYASPAAYSLLPELFFCLTLALSDSHLSDKYSTSLLSAINSICENCSKERRSSAGALRSIKKATRNADANIRAYAVGAACMLGTPGALCLMLKLLEDRETCRLCLDLEEYLSNAVGLLFSVNPKAALAALGRMLLHLSSEVRMYAASSLLLFGRPDSPPRLAEAAHKILRYAMISGSEDVRAFYAQGMRASLGQERMAPSSPQAKKMKDAACAFYKRFPNLHVRLSGGADGGVLHKNGRFRVVDGGKGRRSIPH